MKHHSAKHKVLTNTLLEKSTAQDLLTLADPMSRCLHVSDAVPVSLLDDRKISPKIE
jgi:hypothetical protein